MINKMDISGFETESDMVAYAKESFSNQCGNPLLGELKTEAINSRLMMLVKVILTRHNPR